MYLKIRLFLKSAKMSQVYVLNHSTCPSVSNYTSTHVFCVGDQKKKPYNSITEEREGERGGGVTVNTCNNALNTSLSSSLNAVITKHRIVVILFVFER